MVVSSDEDYGSDPGLQSPETPDFRASMTKAAQCSLHRADYSCSEGIHQGPWLACDLPGAHCAVAQVSGPRGAKKMARDLQESVVLSGKRTRTATVTFVAESVGLIK